MSGFPKINLADLPGPTIIEQVDFETVLADIKVDFLARHPDGAAELELESSTTTKLLETAAYRETILLNRINQSAAAVMLATAHGADIDNLAALVPLKRLDGGKRRSFSCPRSIGT